MLNIFHFILQPTFSHRSITDFTSCKSALQHHISLGVSLFGFVQDIWYDSCSLWWPYCGASVRGQLSYSSLCWGWAMSNWSYLSWQPLWQRLSHTLMINFSLRTLPSWKKVKLFLQVRGVSNGLPLLCMKQPKKTKTEVIGSKNKIF